MTAIQPATKPTATTVHQLGGVVDAALVEGGMNVVDDHGADLRRPA